MKFITIRDFRTKSKKIQEDLPGEKEMVLTSNGKPIAIITSITEDNLEDSLNAVRRAKAIYAVNRLQSDSLKNGKSNITFDEINSEIKAVRNKRKKK